MKSIILIFALASSLLYGQATKVTKTDAIVPNASAGTDVTVDTNLVVTGDSTVQGKFEVVNTTLGSKPCPAMTEVQRDAISAPELGDCVTNSDSNSLNVYDGAVWGEIGGGGGISAWLTATEYEIGNIVVESNKIYKALTNHTSGTFATDLAANDWIEISNDATTLTGVVPLANGGTAKNITASNGAVLYSDTDSVELLAPGTAGQILQTNGVAAPTFVNKSISGKAQNVTAVTMEELQVPNNLLTQTDTGKYLNETGNTNLLSNPSFEHATYDTDWTYSGSATKSEETSVIFEGKKAVKIITSANTFDLSQSTTSNASNLGTVNGLVSVRVKTTDSNVSICSLVDGSEDRCVIASQSNAWVDYPIPVVMGATSTGVKVKSSSSSATTYIDKAFVGVMPSNLMPDIAQAQIAGESYFAGTVNCAWARGSTTIGAFTVDTDCPGPTVVRSNIGIWQTTDADLPIQTVNSLPAGDYKATFIFETNMTGAATSAIAINDGTTTCFANAGNYSATASSGQTVSCTFSYTSAANRSFQLYVGSSANSVELINSRTAPAIGIRFLLEYFPPVTKIYADRTDFFIDASIGGASFTQGSTSTPVAPTSGSLDMVLNSGTARIPCSSTNVATGLTCSSGTEQVGVNFIAPKTGVYQFCVSMVANGGGSSFTGRLAITSNSAQTILQTGKAQSGMSSGSNAPFNLCDRFYLQAGEQTMRTFFENNGTMQIEIDRSVSLYERTANIQVSLISSEIVGTFKNIPVVPSAEARVDVFSFSFGTTNATTNCSASPCSYLDQIGAAVTSVTRASTGVYTLVLARTYTKLKCAVGGLLTGGTDAARFTTPLQCASCSSLPFTTANQASTVFDTAGTILCTGTY
jgi:hypothetical protein